MKITEITKEDKIALLNQLLGDRPGLSKANFARALGATPQTVTNWTLGHTFPRGDEEKRMWQYFNLTGSEEVTQDGERYVITNLAEESAERQLYGTPLPEPDMLQVAKFGQFLDYLFSLKVITTLTALAASLSFPEMIVMSWAEGKRSIPASVLERIAHRWEVKEEFWSAAADATIYEFLGEHEKPHGSVLSRKEVKLIRNPERARAFARELVRVVDKYLDDEDDGEGGIPSDNSGEMGTAHAKRTRANTSTPTPKKP